MCFSAAASFSVAAVTAAIGLSTLRHVTRPQEYLLAAVPLLFASQQAVEGVLWLQLSAEGGAGYVPALSLVFLIYAKVLWPTYSGLTVLLVEPDQGRQRVLLAIAAAGFILSIYLLAGLAGEPHTAFVRNHSIAYASEVTPLSWWHMPYLLCTTAPLLLSSHRTIQVFGAVILAGFLVSAYAYLATFVSVWCFFAAGGSALVYLYFRRVVHTVVIRES